jgi:hypothetical protein
MILNIEKHDLFEILVSKKEYFNEMKDREKK